ncbi:hypothetical protein [Pedobacter jeongneungensis]|uniref:hypothetical protein n=1 Tax=Pedobacter jeongneungensis TaxID=947309 RepID=UPI00046909D6|nr:hypothetical protein [Pedobacter jeongneungensis]
MGWNSRAFMLRFVVLLSFSALSFQQVMAQSWSEWFRQKKIQERYLLEQIAALRLYGSYVKKGYQLVSGGVNVVRDLSKGELDVHQLFFASLSRVNPVVRSSAKVTGIIELELEMVKLLSAVRRVELAREAKINVVAVADGLSKESLAGLEELLSLVLSGEVELSDAERLERLDALHEGFRERLVLVRQLVAEVFRLSRLQAAEESEVFRLRRWYE